MKLPFLSIFKPSLKKTRRTIEDYKNELLIRQGAEQFKKLTEKGLGVPVALL